MKLHMKKAINKNYLLLLIGQTISQLGSSMTSFAVVIWAYSSTGKVLSSSLLAVCSAVPYLLISLFGGAVADNMNKKKIMLFCDSVAAIGSLAILLCCYMNCLEIWILSAWEEICSGGVWLYFWDASAHRYIRIIRL